MYCSVFSSKIRSFAIAFASVLSEFIADAVDFLYVLLFPISNFLYSSVVSSYKVLVLSAGTIIILGSFLYFSHHRIVAFWNYILPFWTQYFGPCRTSNFQIVSSSHVLVGFNWFKYKISSYLIFILALSLKNIPLPNKDTDRKNLIQKVESFIKRIKWKTFFFERQCEDKDEITINFGFKSVNTPPKNEKLKVTCSTWSKILSSKR